MPAPKRKSPDKKKPVRQPGLASTLLMAAGRGVLRHPKPIFGVTAFGVIFSFVAANALWYQPGDHPHPFLATRDNHDPNGIAGYRPMRRVAPEDVTTFRIERADPNAAVPAQTQQPRPQTVQQQSVPQPVEPTTTPQFAAPVVTPRPAATETARAVPIPPAKPAAQPFPATPKATAASVTRQTANSPSEDPVAAAIRASARGSSMVPPADIPNTASTPRAGGAMPVPLPVPQRAAAATDLVLQIQRGLSNIAYADVEVDGVAGTQTKAAIRRFQKHYRLPETGEPDELVLKKLKSIGAL